MTKKRKKEMSWLTEKVAYIFNKKDKWYLELGHLICTRYEEWQINLLYDLIKADIVVKE